jgi:hypothetical protein
LKFLGELWAGRACARTNEVELTKVPKSGGRRKKKRGGRRKNVKAGRKKWDPCGAGGQPLVAVADQSPIAGCPLVGDQRFGG